MAHELVVFIDLTHCDGMDCLQRSGIYIFLLDLGLLFLFISGVLSPVQCEHKTLNTCVVKTLKPSASGSVCCRILCTSDRNSLKRFQKVGHI